MVFFKFYPIWVRQIFTIYFKLLKCRVKLKKGEKHYGNLVVKEMGRKKRFENWQAINLPQKVYQELDRRKSKNQPFWELITKLLEETRGSSPKLPPEGDLPEQGDSDDERDHQ